MNSDTWQLVIWVSTATMPGQTRIVPGSVKSWSFHVIKTLAMVPNLPNVSWETSTRIPTWSTWLLNPHHLTLSVSETTWQQRCAPLCQYSETKKLLERASTVRWSRRPRSTSRYRNCSREDAMRFYAWHIPMSTTRKNGQVASLLFLFCLILYRSCIHTLLLH